MAETFDKIIQLMIVMQILRSLNVNRQGGNLSINFPEKITLDVPELQSIGDGIQQLIEKYDTIYNMLNDMYAKAVDIDAKIKDAEEIVIRKTVIEKKTIVDHQFEVTVGVVSVGVTSEISNLNITVGVEGQQSGGGS